MHISEYEHEPILNPCKTVHLTGNAKPATVLITFNEPGILPNISFNISALVSTVIVPGWVIGFKIKKNLELRNPFSYFNKYHWSH